MAKYLIAIVLDIALAVCAYAWLAHGVTGAWNVFIFMMWMTAICSWLVGFFADKDTFITQRPVWFYPWHVATDVAAVAVLAWTGNYVLAGIYAFGHFMQEAARNRAPKVK